MKPVIAPILLSLLALPTLSLAKRDHYAATRTANPTHYSANEVHDIEVAKLKPCANAKGVQVPTQWQGKYVGPLFWGKDIWIKKPVLPNDHPAYPTHNGPYSSSIKGQVVVGPQGIVSVSKLITIDNQAFKQNPTYSLSRYDSRRLSAQGFCYRQKVEKNRLTLLLTNNPTGPEPRYKNSYEYSVILKDNSYALETLYRSVTEDGSIAPFALAGAPLAISGWGISKLFGARYKFWDTVNPLNNGTGYSLDENVSLQKVSTR